MENQPQCVIDDKNSSKITITLSGHLDITSIKPIWQQCTDTQKRHQPKQLTINAKNITYCDGACIALFTELHSQQNKLNSQFEIDNLNTHFQKLLNTVTKQPIQTIPTGKSEQLYFANNVGQFTLGLVATLRENITFLGKLSYLFMQTILHPQTIRWKDMWFAAEDVGPKAFPIIALIGFLIGLISTFQSASPLGEFGAQLYIINLVGLGLVREMGPLMTAVLLAGRTASAFAAEIGTMKINQELDALTTMGLDPTRFLTMPRVIATTIMTPVLNIFLIIFGLIGCSIVMHTLGYPLQTFLNQLKSSIDITDVMTGLVKAFAFGIVISSVGCFHGLKTRFGSSAVGYSTTQAVVNSLIMIVIIDGIFAVLYYTFGI